MVRPFLAPSSTPLSCSRAGRNLHCKFRFLKRMIPENARGKKKDVKTRHTNWPHLPCGEKTRCASTASAKQSTISMRRRQPEPQKQELSRRARRRSDRDHLCGGQYKYRRGEESGRKKRARDQRKAGGREDLDGGRSACLLLLNSAAPPPRRRRRRRRQTPFAL